MNSRIGIFTIVAVLLVVKTYVDATPSGYYREQHEYQKNEERYVNGELHHSSHDAEFLAKQGELAAVTVSPPTKHHFKHHEEYNKKKEEQEDSVNEHEHHQSNLMKQMRKNEHNEQLINEKQPVFMVNMASDAAAKRALDENLKAELSMSAASMSYGHQVKTDERSQNADKYGNNRYGLPILYDSTNEDYWNGPKKLESSSVSDYRRKENNLRRVTLHKDSNIRQPFNWSPNPIADEADATQLSRQCYQAWKAYSSEEMNRKLRESNIDIGKQFSSEQMQSNDQRLAAGYAQQYGYSQRQQYSANANFRNSFQ